MFVQGTEITTNTKFTVLLGNYCNRMDPLSRLCDFFYYTLGFQAVQFGFETRKQRLGHSSRSFYGRWDCPFFQIEITRRSHHWATNTIESWELSHQFIEILNRLCGCRLSAFNAQLVNFLIRLVESDLLKHRSLLKSGN